MAKIYCFSSTGNSLYIAKNIADKIGAQVLSMSKPQTICADDVIGFVFPVYFWALPKIVENFVSNLQIENKSAYIFAIATHGGDAYGVSGLLGKLLRRKGVSLQYSKRIKSVENYIPMYQINDTEALHKKVDSEIEKAAKEIALRKQNKSEACTLVNSLIYTRFPGKKGDCDKKFSISPGCVNCGCCEEICPVNNIVLQNGKPEFLHNCEHCLACVHVCPMHTIEWKQSTNNKGRYRNPNIDIKELTEFCGAISLCKGERKVKQHHNWNDVFENPCDITIKSLNTGYVVSKKEGIINTRSKMYQGQCVSSKAKLPVLAHLITYKDAHYLVDTGFDSSFAKRWGGSFQGILRPFYFRSRYYQADTSLGIDKQLKAKQIDIDTIFLTHAHEHSSGLGPFDNTVRLVIGKGEKDIDLFPLVYSTQIKSRQNIRELDFNADGTHMPIIGKCIDVFGDGSFWAIDTHGHTKGHISYLINGIERIVLLTGDVSITSLGFSIGVETGTFSENAADTKMSFDKIKEFTNQYPQIEVIFGHEVVGEFEIEF